MPDVLAAAWATPGLDWIALAALLAGLVYGFAGFGAALVFMPVATAFVPPTVAIAALATIAISSLVTVVPQAWRKANQPAAVSMIAVAFVTIPVGVAVLRVADPDLIRWTVIAIASVTLIALLTGWRRKGPDTAPARLSVAGAAGFFGGAVGLNGPLLILFQLSGSGRAEEVRANTIVFLSITGLAVLPVLVVQGMIGAPAMILGTLLAVPYVIGCLSGQALFRPGQERLYRNVAYTIIGAAILAGMPIWG